MNWVDIVIVVALVINVFVGLKIGIIKAALSLAGVIVGVVLAGQYYAPLAARLTFISQESIANAVAFAIILIAVMVVAGLLAAFLKWAVSAMLLGWVNHLGGAILGLFMGAIFCGALLAIWIKFLGTPDIITDSFLAATLLEYFPAVLAFLPAEFDTVRSFFQ